MIVNVMHLKVGFIYLGVCDRITNLSRSQKSDSLKAHTGQKG